MSIETAYQTLYDIVLVALLLLVGIMLIRLVKRSGITDRIMSVNMIGTLIISMIAILSLKLGESYLCDIALIYAMISFLSVLMLTSMNTPVSTKKKYKNKAAGTPDASANRKKGDSKTQ